MFHRPKDHATRTYAIGPCFKIPNLCLQARLDLCPSKGFQKLTFGVDIYTQDTELPKCSEPPYRVSGNWFQANISYQYTYLKFLFSLSVRSPYKCAMSFSSTCDSTGAACLLLLAQT